MVEEKVYCKYMGEHSPTEASGRIQGGHDQTELGHMGRGKKGVPDAGARRPKYKRVGYRNVWII